MKKIILILFAFLLGIILTNTAYAENFTIDRYDIDINVLENRTFEISERINANFTIPSHGIYRNIPTKSKILRPNGSYDIQRGRIHDLQVSNLHSTSYINGDIVLKMGNPDKKITGKQTYNIKYKYDASNDNLKDADEFYFNIIGSKWKTSISRVYFKLTLPKYFDSSKITFYMGEKGNIDRNPQHLKYKVSNNVISGYTTTVLNPNEALTIRIELPEDYFTKRADFSPWAIILTMLLTAYPIMLWAVFGKDGKVIPVVNFDIPKDQNSAEIEVIYSGQSTYKGIYSLIFYLASKGYIEITGDDFEFTINKIRDYDGKNIFEKAMMNALFVGDSNYITSTQIEGSLTFYKYCAKIQRQLNRRKNYLFDKYSCTPDKISIILLSLFGLGLLIIYTFGGYTFDLLSNGLAWSLLFPLIAFIVWMFIIQTKKIKDILFMTVFSLLYGGIPVFGLIVPFVINTCNFKVLLFELLCFVISTVCLFNMPRRSAKGRMLLGKIIGLKRYLEVVEQNRLIHILEENPNYISDILPYAYVLEVVDYVLECVDGYSKAVPHWYHGNSFSPHFISNITNCFSRSASRSRSSRGRSGGGIGGGGGGSW